MTKKTLAKKAAKRVAALPGPDISKRGRRYLGAYLTGVLDTQGPQLMIKTAQKIAAAKGVKVRKAVPSKNPAMRDGMRAVETLGLTLTVWGPVMAKAGPAARKNRS